MAMCREEEEDTIGGNSQYHQTIELISSLISLSHLVQVFSAKWQSIRDNLEGLVSTLSCIHNSSCDKEDQDPSFITALHSITSTLEHCHQLARSCVDVSYSGKLLMKSDLDIICGRLNNHLKGLSEIYNLGLITHKNYAIVLTRPGAAAASKDDMKIYLKDLFSRLKIGTTDMKLKALLALNQVFQEDGGTGIIYVKIAMEVIDTFIITLVHFLEPSSSSEEEEEDDDDIIQQEAIKALTFIAISENYRNTLISSGIVAPLIRILECGGSSDSCKESAARCLMKLTENSDNAWSVSAHGGVTALLKICCCSSSNEELVSSACGVLKNLVGVEEIKRFMVEEGAIPCFINLVSCKHGPALICSIDFLQTMASGDESIKQIIVQEGGVGALVRVLDPKLMFPTKAREVALKGIMSFSCLGGGGGVHTILTLSMLLNYGFLDHVLYFLRYGEVGVQELALKGSFWLCGTSEEAKKAMGDGGIMLELVKFLDSSSLDVREMAAETLHGLILIPKNRKRLMQNDENVGLILQVLVDQDDDEMNSGNKKLLLTLIMSLTITSSNSARKKIVNSGYLKKIEEKLADSGHNAADAKKIVKKLTSSNRLRSFLNGIWH